MDEVNVQGPVNEAGEGPDGRAALRVPSERVVTALRDRIADAIVELAVRDVAVADLRRRLQLEQEHGDALAAAREVDLAELDETRAELAAYRRHATRTVKARVADARGGVADAAS